MNFSDCAAVCDVDRNHVEKGRATALRKRSPPVAERSGEMFEDCRKLLDRDDIDVVTILTHNHGSRAAQQFHCALPT
jgi:predicted dehydrogenase